MKIEIIEWLKRDAEWWEFWHPSSGIIGGFIMGVIVFTALVVL